MDFDIPKELADYLRELDEFIEREIIPLEQQDDNARFFDYRREDARTDWDRGGLPNEAWEALLAEARRRADAAGHYRYPFPKEYGGRDGTNLGMAVIREHFAAKGLGGAIEEHPQDPVGVFIEPRPEGAFGHPVAFGDGRQDQHETAVAEVGAGCQGRDAVDDDRTFGFEQDLVDVRVKLPGPESATPWVRPWPPTGWAEQSISMRQAHSPGSQSPIEEARRERV